MRRHHETFRAWEYLLFAPVTLVVKLPFYIFSIQTCRSHHSITSGY